MLYNRLSEIGLDVKDVRFPTWGAALSCILQFSYPREGMVNDALMTAMGAPWLNTKLVVAVSPDTNLDDPGDVYHAIATRCDPARDVIMVPNTRGSPYDPSARPLEGQYPWRIVGKMGIDATIKSRHDPADFERAWPRNWGKVKLRYRTISSGKAMRAAMDAIAPPKPKVLFEAEPFIPYVREEDFDPRLKPVVEPYKKRMGFLPNALKLYAYRPEIAETLWKLNSNIMRDPSSTLDQFLKRKLAAVACATNGCAYCTAHSCAMLKKPKEVELRRLGHDRGRAAGHLTGAYEPKNEMERACFDYVRAASEDPTSVPDEILQRLKQHLTPPQIIELACVVGFWKFYNTVHDSLHIPVESTLLADTGYVDL